MADSLDREDRPEPPQDTPTTRWLRLILHSKQVCLTLQDGDGPKVGRQVSFKAGDYVVVRWPDTSVTEERVEMLGRPPNEAVSLPYVRKKLRGLDTEVPIWSLEVRTDEVLKVVVDNIRQNAQQQEAAVRLEFARASVGCAASTAEAQKP